MNKLFVFFLFLISCNEKQIVFTDIQNNCMPPKQLEYELLNDPAKNAMVLELMEQWPPEIRDYLKNKMQNRLYNSALCDFKLIEYISYEKCLLSLISNQTEAR